MAITEENNALYSALVAHLPALLTLQSEITAEGGSDDLVSYIYGIQGLAMVYLVQEATEKIMATLISVLPGQQLSSRIKNIIKDGTGIDCVLVLDGPPLRSFGDGFKAAFDKARPVAEAYLHARFLLNQAVKYGSTPQSPELPYVGGWQALKTIYSLHGSVKASSHQRSGTGKYAAINQA